MHTHTHTIIQQDAEERACKNLHPQCYWHEFVHLCQTSFTRIHSISGKGSNSKCWSCSWINRRQDRSYELQAAYACCEMRRITWDAGWYFVFVSNVFGLILSLIGNRYDMYMKGEVSLHPSVSASAENHQIRERNPGTNNPVSVCLCAVSVWERMTHAQALIYA